MELVKELFLTGFVALVFSFLVAKLVSIVMSTDDPASSASIRDADVAESEQDLLSADRLQVQGNKVEEVTATPETTLERVPIEELHSVEEAETAPLMETELEEEEAADDRAGVVVPVAEEEVAIKERDHDGVRGRDVGIEDDWEGIERSEVEEAFRKAARLVRLGEEEARLTGEGFQLELYGLYKVATEGPCRESAPMALKLCARSKWNAWQSLGNMTPETAMEKYIALVSERVPGWMDKKMNRGGEATGAEDASLLGLDSATVSSHDVHVTNERNAEPRPDPVSSDLSKELFSESRV